MDFFESQDHARKQTTRLVVLFTLAVIAIAGTLYAVAVVASGYRGNDPRTGSPVVELIWDDPEMMVTVALATLLVVGGGSLYKIAQLRSGGGRFVAESLGGRLLHGDSTDPLERRVLNVVEEMAIAAGTTVPPVYLMEKERGINAFAAGFEPADAVVAVTRGCAEILSRDELQGVVAHEFSHILNGDMRLNIRLMGILHGILIIGIIGYFVMRSSLFAGHSRRSDRGNAGMVLVFVGIALAVIGFLGTFFGNMIKATVSRQREYLADASAVQFTRSTEGIAGALAKIGGFEGGSRLESPNAPEVSHAFFASGLAAGLSSIFSTHPPLEDRIRRLDPSWQPALEVAAPHRSADVLAGAAGFAGKGSAAERVSAPHAVEAVEHVGSPTAEHVSYARQLVGRLPEPVVAAAHEPYGARALVFALLVSREATVRERQLSALELQVEPTLYRETAALLPALDALGGEVRLPLVDMSLPALLELTSEQYSEFASVVSALSKADDRIDLFEWALQRVLLAHLAPNFDSRARGRRRVRYSRIRGLGPQLSALLSTLAQVHPEEPGRVRRAFDAGARCLASAGRVDGLSLLPREACGLGVLDEALSELADAKPALKRAIVTACAEAVCSDEHLSVAESELLRAVADALGCPMPPMLAGPIARL